MGDVFGEWWSGFRRKKVTFAAMVKEGAAHLVANIGGVLAKEDVLNSTEAYVFFVLWIYGKIRASTTDISCMALFL